MKMFDFTTKKDGTLKTLSISGNVECRQEGEPCIPCFQDVEIAEILEDGTLWPFQPSGTTWMGRPITCEDTTADIFYRITRNETGTFQLLYMAPPIQELVDKYRALGTAIIVNGREIPKVVCYDEQDLMELYIATDRFCYYACEDDVLMLDTDTEEILSYNCFAEDCLDKSMEAVSQRKENLLYNNPFFPCVTCT